MGVGGMTRVVADLAAGAVQVGFSIVLRCGF